MIECEIKLKIKNPEEIKNKLLSLGFTESARLTETDTYFDNQNGDIRSNDNALRIRETINHTKNHTYCQINYKGKKLDNKTMSRPEYEVEVSSAEDMAKILSFLGYYPVSVQVKKNRTTLRDVSLTACIDCVEGLGDFLELEAIVANEDQKDYELNRINGILAKLGYSLADTTTTSYLSALQNMQ